MVQARLTCQVSGPGDSAVKRGAEVRRLEELIVRAIDMVKDANTTYAQHLEEELDTKRILPENVRPVVERPIHLAEREVVYVKTRGRRWW